MIGHAEGAIAELETAMKGDDKGQIESKSKQLESLFQELSQAAQGAAAGAGAAGADAGAAPSDDVVDAEFTEVKDDENKS